MFDLDSALGVEIRPDRMVLTTLSKRLTGYAVKHHHVIEGYAELDRSQLFNLVQNYVRSNGFNRENVILGVPREQAVVRSVELPLDVEENLEQVLRFQVGKLEPGDENPSYSDFLVLERDEQAKSILLQIVMIPRPVLDEYLTLMKELNLFPAAIRLSCYGLHQLFRLHSDGFSKPALVVQVDRNRVEVLLSLGMNQVFTHVFSVAFEDLTVDKLLDEIGAYVSRLRLKIDGFAKAFLCGSKGAEFLAPLRERLGDVELLSSGLKLNVAADSPGRLERIYAAAGLAVSGMNTSSFSRFNLIPPERRVAGERSSLIPTVVLVVLLMVTLIAAGTRQYVQQNHLLGAVDGEVQRLKPEVTQALEVRKQVESKLEQASQLAQIMTGRQTVLDVMRELTEIIPEDAYLQSLNVRNEEVSITGLSDSASSLINVLSESKCLVNVESRYITRDASTGKDKFNFEAKLMHGGCRGSN